MMQAVPFAPCGAGARAVLTGVSKAHARLDLRGGAGRQGAVARRAADDRVLVDQYAIGDERAPGAGARVLELFYGVAISNDVSARPGTTDAVSGLTGTTSASRSGRTSRAGFIFVIYSIVRQVVMPRIAAASRA